jgi:type III secretion system FlhB-like substrate exporter
MTAIEIEEERTYDILIYGIEKLSLKAPREPLRTRNFCLYFEPFSTQRRFHEFDGAVLFQGIFEHFEWKRGVMDSYLDHSCHNNELDKRKKEAELLIGGGGFLCFLLNQPFVDIEDRQDFRGSDLSKYHLNYSQFYRENFQQRVAQLNIKSDEFRKFLEVYGAASSHFHHYNKSIEWHVIAEAAGRVAGMIINRAEYFIPTLIPDNVPEVIQEYFTLLVDALTSTANKLHQELPSWVAEFSFLEEAMLDSERTTLEARIAAIAQRKASLSKYKSVLALSSDALVASVVDVLAHGFGIPVDTNDELREDFKMLDDKAQPFCLCEVKGTNKGLKREHLNQADSHRERSGFRDDFPAAIIINTHMKNARSVAEKGQEIAREQILHARKMGILILRSIDLLRLLKFHLNGQITLAEVKNLFTQNSGWLRVGDAGWTIVTGEDVPETD